MFTARYGVLVSIILVAAASSLAAAPKVPPAVSQSMQDRKFTEAVTAIEQAAGDEKFDQDYLTYLKGRALYFQEKYDEAIAVYDALQQQYPDSPWARHARFAKGLSLARKGDFRAAELVYRAEAQDLFSLDRKQEIADLYLEYADVYFKPPKDDQKPDYEKAYDFYQRALKVGPKPESRVQIELRSAECLQHLEKWSEAAVAYRQFLADHEDDALVVEARFRLGETLLKNGEPVESRRQWRDLLDLHPGSDSDRLPQAAFRIAETYGLPTPSDDEDLMLGVAALKSFLEKYPDHKLASKAYLLIAESYHNRGRHDDAARAVRQFLGDERYQNTEQVPAARRLLGYAYKMQGKFDEAIAAWKEFLTSHPTDPAWSQVQQEI
ncbi:MAG: tetratricopeptide repeat protein, partial [Planctomycetes bacterium]|nr:tetratricopeptide repeat protein [Planctomycetota bacterium]